MTKGYCNLPYSRSRRLERRLWTCRTGLGWRLVLNLSLNVWGLDRRGSGEGGVDPFRKECAGVEYRDLQREGKVKWKRSTVRGENLYTSVKTLPQYRTSLRGEFGLSVKVGLTFVVDDLPSEVSVSSLLTAVTRRQSSNVSFTRSNVLSRRRQAPDPPSGQREVRSLLHLPTFARLLDRIAVPTGRPTRGGGRVSGSGQKERRVGMRPWIPTLTELR